jgi:hypothetical protein
MKKTVLLAVLAYDGRVDAFTMQSIINNIILLNNEYNTAFIIEQGCC